MILLRKTSFALVTILSLTSCECPFLDEIEGYCRAELLGGKERKSIGFIS